MAADDVMPTQAGHGEAAQHLSHDGRRPMLDGAAGGSTVVPVTQCRLGGALGHLHWATDSRRTGGLRPKSSGSIADLHLSRSS
jgi:hypothetical protein